MPIPDDIDPISKLLFKSLAEQFDCSKQEELIQWKNLSAANAAVYEEFCQGEQWQLELKELLQSKRDIDELLKDVGVPTGISVLQSTVPRIHFMKTAWVRYAAAVVILLGIGAYLYTSNQKQPEPVTTAEPVPLKNDIQPGGNKATLTLADGSVIVLDSAAGGQLATEQGAVIFKNAQGEIIYNAVGKANKVVYNTMSTPKGGQYQLKLPDGTRVWLNAASSITYPTVFPGQTREVKITGEAYFEVKANKERPFIVKTFTDEITVLGTSFNVNAYRDEPVSKTSLLQGSVRINNEVLRPGEAYQTGKITKTDVSQDVAWKNGFFNFDRMTIDQVARQLARWYDIEIKFEGQVPKEKLFGNADRNLSLNDLLQGLEGQVASFKLDGRTLIIKSL